jgi:hypothetical protein
VSRPLSALYLFAALTSLGSSAYAIETGPLRPSTPEECESALSNVDFLKTEAFRAGLWKEIRQKMSSIESARQTLMVTLDLELENRANFKPSANIRGNLAGKLGLGNNQMQSPPLVADTTHDAMERFMARTSNDDYRQLRQLLGNAIAADPYFKWLRDHAVDGRKNGDKVRANTFTIESDELVPVRVSADPIEYFFSRLDISGPGFLPAKLNLIRVYRDLDPELSPKQAQLADNILKLYGIEVLIHLDFREQFQFRNNGWASKEAWDLAPDLKTAQKNYRKLLDKQKKWNSQMSEKGYRLAQQMYIEQGPALAVIRRILNNQAEPEDQQAFVELKTRLSLDQKHSAREVFDLIIYAGNERVSRVQFMMRKFGGREGEKDDRTLSGLQKIIEIAEAIQSEEAFIEFLREKISAAHYIRP